MTARTDEDNARTLANHLRIAAKQLRWAADNLASAYNLVKPEDMPPLFVDPNQLTIFDTIEDTQQ